MKETETFTFEKPNAFQISWIIKHLNEFFDEGGEYQDLHEKLGLSKMDYDYLQSNGGFTFTLIANDYINVCEKLIQLHSFLNDKKDVSYEELKKIIGY